MKEEGMYIILHIANNVLITIINEALGYLIDLAYYYYYKSLLMTRVSV